MNCGYCENQLYLRPVTYVPGADGDPILDDSDEESEPIILSTVPTSFLVQVARVISLFGVAGGAALKIWALKAHEGNTKLDILADLVAGVSAAALAQVSLPEKTRQNIFGLVKHWSVPLLIVAAGGYLRLAHDSSIARQLLLTSFIFAAGAVSADDLVQSITQSANRNERIEERHPRREQPLEMLEGDANDTKKIMISQGCLLTTGIFMLVLGIVLKPPMLTDNLRSIGSCFQVWP